MKISLLIVYEIIWKLECELGVIIDEVLNKFAEFGDEELLGKYSEIMSLYF